MRKEHFDKIGKGSISISSVVCGGVSNTKEDYISIRIEDALSHTLFLEIEMDYKSFAKAVTSSGSMPIQFGIRKTERIGKKLEVKDEKVQLPKSSFNCTTEEEKKALSKYEVDGWIGRREDLHNHHNFIGDNTYKVTFVRWVDTEEGDGKE